MSNFQGIFNYTDADLMYLRQGHLSPQMYDRLEDDLRIESAKFLGGVIIEGFFVYVTIRWSSITILWAAFGLLMLILFARQLRQKTRELYGRHITWVTDNFRPKLGVFGRWYLVDSQNNHYPISQNQYSKLARDKYTDPVTVFYWPYSKRVIAVERGEKTKRDNRT